VVTVDVVVAGGRRVGDPVIGSRRGSRELSDVELREYVRTRSPIRPSPAEIRGGHGPDRRSATVAVGTVIVTDETAEVELVVKV